MSDRSLAQRIVCIAADPAETKRGLDSVAARCLGIVDANRQYDPVAWVCDIFGNPFRPVSLNPKYLTPIVRQVAATVYEDRNFAQLPILADLLQEAGCDCEEVLKHLRAGGEHVRGCWALDLVLGKS